MIDQVDKLGCTICLDEFESSSLGTGDDFTQMLKGGYKKGGSYSKKEGNKSVRLNTYSPKVLASIDAIGDEALKSRTIPVKTVVSPDLESLKVWDANGSAEQNRAEIIRNGCYALGLFHHRSIQRFYHRVPSVIELPNKGTLSTRKREVFAPLVAMAQLIDVNNDSGAESDLLKAVEIAWDTEKAGLAKNEKLLSEQLAEWRREIGFEAFTHKGEMTWIHTDCWDDTALSAELGGKKTVLDWLGSLQGVTKTKSTHLKALGGSKSCTGFPDNLNINGKPFREWFSRK